MFDGKKTEGLLGFCEKATAAELYFVPKKDFLPMFLGLKIC